MPIAGPNGEGFVACVIPASPFKPHRSEHCNKQYYLRGVGSFYEAGPGILRTLFYPHAHPDLCITATLSFALEPVDVANAHRQAPEVLSYNKLINSTSNIDIAVRITNRGTATAKDAYVVLDCDDLMNFYPSNSWRIGPTKQGQAGFSAMRPLHPGEDSDLFSASFQRTFPNTSSLEHDNWGIVPSFHSISLRFLVHSENEERRVLHVTFLGRQMSYLNPSISIEGTPDPVQRAGGTGGLSNRGDRPRTLSG